MTSVSRHLVRDALRELADEAYQRRLWTEPQGPEVGSLTEAICRLFDDSGLGDALDNGQEIFGPPVDSLLVGLGDLLDGIDVQQQPRAILDDPFMVDVRRLAGGLLGQIEAAERGVADDSLP